MTMRTKTQGSPITLRSRRLVCQNSKWNVYFDHIAGEAEQQVPDYLVIAPKVVAENLVTGICVLPIREGKVVLLEVWRHGAGECTWEGARGFVDQGEQPHQSALRELKEETGLSCDPAHLVPLGYVLPEASTMAARVALFAATQCRHGGGRDSLSELGLGEPSEFTPEEVAEMAADSRLQDVSTLVAFYRYTARVQQRI